MDETKAGTKERERACEKHPSHYLFEEDCGSCGGEGWTEPGELYEQDPLWYGEDDVERCSACSGRGWFYECQACIDGDPPEVISEQPAPQAPPTTDGSVSMAGKEK